MSAFDHFSSMYDVALKPRLLRTLIKEHVPDEEHPFSIPSELSRVVYIIKTHRLLSESSTESKDRKQIESWNSAVDSWVERICTLLSSNMQANCWAGISLLGVTCQECSSGCFLKYYSEWFQKLLSFLQSPGDSHLVKMASCASISDLFARLSGYSHEKKDGSYYAGKVIQPVLKLLNEDKTEALWDVGLNLLCTLITSFPFAIHRHYDSVETAIASKILPGECSPEMLKKLAFCLALLPKSRGDEESWSVMMQKILIVINDQLNNAFQGIEETKCDEVNRLLVLPGKDPPPPLGGNELAEEASKKATKRSERLLMSNASTLMLCCCMMLSNSYPVKVNVPVRLLLVLVERVLMVNGSLPPMSLPFITVKQQENICSELPVLHSNTLDLLTAIIKGVGSQLLPHAASIVRIITIYFKTCALPELRVKVYSVATILLISMGVGMALSLAQEVISNAFIDLSTTRNKSGCTLNNSNSNASNEAFQQPSRRKRKHSITTGSLQEHEETSGLRVEAPQNHPVAPISLRIAAVETLEALVTVAGALNSEKWRSNVDSLLIDIAMDSFKEGFVNEEISMFQQREFVSTSADLQLAALRALLASFLSFGRVRPPYLAQGLELFRRGKQQIGTRLAGFCAHALLALEVLLHPRALPLADYSYGHHSSFGDARGNFRDEYAVGQDNSTQFGRQQVGHDTPESDDDLYQKWLETDKEPYVPMAEDTNYIEEPSGSFGNNDPKLLFVQHASGAEVQQDQSEQLAEAATCADIEMRVGEDEIIVKSDQPRECTVQFQEPVLCTNMSLAESASGSVAAEIVTERIVSDSTPHHNVDSQMESGQANLFSDGGESASQTHTFSGGITNSDRGHGSAINFDDDDSSADEDALPDIVDADPDSDFD